MNLPTGTTYDPEQVAAFLINCGCPRPVFEHQFCPGRKWAFDLAWPEHLVALEVHGGIWAGGRHVRPEGFLLDMEKENAAATLGWRILKTTPRSVRSFGTAQMVKTAIAFR